MRVPHFGQAEGGQATDFSFGMRQMQTLRKLPKQRPKAKMIVDQ
jgi:hypothetical protein